MREGTHKHKCENCGTVWEHNDGCMLLSQEIFEQTHTCRFCGERVQRKYFGPEKALLAQDCRDTEVCERILV